MITLRVQGEVTADRKLVLSLPPEVAPGKVEVELRLRAAPDSAPYSRPGLLEWAEQNAEDWGDRIRSDDVEGFTGRRY
jgi:hypothetical protein